MFLNCGICEYCDPASPQNLINIHLNLFVFYSDVILLVTIEKYVVGFGLFHEMC